MDLATLRSHLRADVASQLDPLYREFQQRTGRSDVDAFTAALHEQGLIDSELFLRLHMAGEVQLLELDEMRSHRIQESGALGVNNLSTLEFETGPQRRYELLGVLGRGAMGEVQVARDLELGRKVAYKRMTGKGEAHKQRFLREIQITSQLQHPAIIPVYGFEVDEEGHLAYAMKLVQGQTLNELVKRTRERFDAGKKLPEELQLEARLAPFVQVCEAVAYAHSRGILHRDLKPDNIMVGSYNEVYLMDWGVARQIAPQRNLGESQVIRIKQAPDFERTRVGVAVGTPAFMSPEQASGLNDELDGRSDVYSLGLILFELVCLRRPLVGKTSMMILVNASRGKREPLQHHAGRTLPPELVAIIDRATEKDLDKRYQTADELADDLRRFLAGREVQALPDNALRKTLRWIGRHRETTLRGLLLVVFAMTVSTLLALRSQEARQRGDRRARQLVVEAQRRGTGLVSDLSRHERALMSLVGAAERALEGRSPNAGAVMTDSEIRDGRLPSDWGAHPAWPVPVSLDTPVVQLAPGLSRSGSREQQQRLASLHEALQSTLLRAQPDGAGFDSEQLPIAAARVALEEGAMAVFPGRAIVEQGYDHREEAWYQQALGATGPVWSGALVDPCCRGPLLSVAHPIRDSNGMPLGVVRLDLSAEMLAMERLGNDRDAFLLDSTWSMLLPAPAGGLLPYRVDEAGQEPVFTRSVSGELIEHLENRAHGAAELDEGWYAWTTLPNRWVLVEGGG